MSSAVRYLRKRAASGGIAQSSAWKRRLFAPGGGATDKAGGAGRGRGASAAVYMRVHTSATGEGVGAVLKAVLGERVR